MLGPFAIASRHTPHYHSPGVATAAPHAICASMSTIPTTTTTTTTRDRGDRYGPMEWAQLLILLFETTQMYIVDNYIPGVQIYVLIRYEVL